MDGKQRTTALIRYLADQFRYELEDIQGMGGKLFSELGEDLQVAIAESTITVRIAKRQLTEDEISLFFSRRQESKRTSTGEHLNANLQSKLRKTSVVSIQNGMCPSC